MNALRKNSNFYFLELEKGYTKQEVRDIKTMLARFYTAEEQVSALNSLRAGIKNEFFGARTIKTADAYYLIPITDAAGTGGVDVTVAGDEREVLENGTTFKLVTVPAEVTFTDIIAAATPEAAGTITITDDVTTYATTVFTGTETPEEQVALIVDAINDVNGYLQASYSGPGDWDITVKAAGAVTGDLNITSSNGPTELGNETWGVTYAAEAITISDILYDDVNDETTFTIADNVTTPVTTSYEVQVEDSERSEIKFKIKGATKII